MLERFISYLQFGNRFCGIEHTTINEKDIIQVICLKKSKKEVDFENSFSELSINKISKKLLKKQHIFIVINNEHVLTKPIENSNAEPLNLVSKAFPNINYSDFYYEIIGQGTNKFISICRKFYIDRIIDEYHDVGLFVTDFSIGNSVVSHIANYIESPIIYTTNAILTFNNNAIETLEFEEHIKEEIYNINGLSISSSSILPFSGALISILKNTTSLQNYGDKKKALVTSFKQVRFFDHFFKAGLAFVVCLLLINFFLFNFYFNEVNVLSGTSRLNETSKNKIIKLSELVNKSQKLSDDILASNISRSTFYVNQIINSLPKSILLSDANYQPLVKKIKEDKPIELQTNTIIVSGDSSNSKSYSDWIASLEKISWIERVEVINYNDSKTSSSQFSIKISVNDK